MVEREIWPDELAKASEVFLTGTAVEVQPVGVIDKREYPVGPITQQLKDDYAALVRVMKSAVTISLVPGGQRRAVRLLGRPRRRVSQGTRARVRCGRDLPARPPMRSTRTTLRSLLDDNGLSLAAVGTGAGLGQAQALAHIAG